MNQSIERRFAVLAVATVIACGGSSSTGGPNPATQEKGLRTVSGVFSTTYQKDDGTRTTVAGLAPTQAVPTAILYADNAGGYTTVPLSLAMDGSFSVSNIPGGTYYLRTEQSTSLIDAAGTADQSALITLSPLTSATPDLNTLRPGRPDAVVPTQDTPVTLNVTGLSPWSTSGRFRDQFFIATAQDQGDESVFLFNSGLPPAGATSFSTTFDWFEGAFDAVDGLPDASKGDTAYFSHRAHFPMPNGCDGAVAKDFAKSTAFTVPPGGGNTANIAMQAAPLSSSIGTNAKLSQFAALVPSMNPAAQLTIDPAELTSPAAGASVFGIPGSLSYPDFPGLNVVVRLAAYDYFGSMSVDTDCGAVPYGGFLDAPYQAMRNFAYQAGVLLAADGGSVAINPAFIAQEPAGSVSTNGIAPVIGPVRAPLVNGQDAFAARAGVGLTPVISWSSPSLGSASDYTVTIQMLSVPDSPSDAGQIVAGVHGATSFKVPAGLLKMGKTYAATITAIDQPSRDPNRPFRGGLPFYSADAVTNTFTP
jgi:hypothetical protein